MFDLSDIGGPKKAARKKKKDRTVILCPIEENRWKEVDLDTTTAEEFMEAIETITAGGIPVSLMDPRHLSTPEGRDRALSQIHQLLKFPISVKGLLGKD